MFDEPFFCWIFVETHCDCSKGHCWDNEDSVSKRHSHNKATPGIANVLDHDAMPLNIAIYVSFNDKNKDNDVVGNTACKDDTCLDSN